MAALLCVVAAPSSERKGAGCLSYLSELRRPPRVFTGCGNLGLWARQSLGTEMSGPGGQGLGNFRSMPPAPLRPLSAASRSGVAARRASFALRSPGVLEPGLVGRGQDPGGGLVRASPSSASVRAGLQPISPASSPRRRLITALRFQEWALRASERPEPRKKGAEMAGRESV